jgi:hypothetical protein
MRSWPGFLIAAIVVSGCGRLGLDQPIEPGGGVAGGGAAGTTGGSGSGGASGAAGTGPTGTGGRIGSPGAAGTSGAGTGGGGATGAGGAAGATGIGGRGGTTGTGGAAGTTGTGGRGGTTGTAGTGGRGGTTGTAGTGGTTGTGGTGAGPMTCVPGRSEACTCATGATGAQVCRADGTFDPCVCVSSEFQRIRDGMVGTWMGQQSNPWTAPYQVRITFTADGHYSAHCAQASCPDPVFYYGSDDDSPLKIYELVDLHQNGTADGRIMLFFGPNNAQWKTLDALYVSLDGQHLTFEFWNGDYGPLVFNLTRVQ